MDILLTPRLQLRWFRREDAPFVRALVNDPDWIRHIGDRSLHTDDAAADWIDARLRAGYGEHGFGFWALSRRSDGELLGMCGLARRPHLPAVDVGYALIPAARGQGYAREAAAACVTYAREVLGLRSLWGITSPDNHRSAAVLAAIGLTDAGHRRLPGEHRPTWVFQWQAHPGQPVDGDSTPLDALVARFLSACSHPASDQPGTLPSLPHLLHAAAVCTHVHDHGAPVVTDRHGFIRALAQRLLPGDEQQVLEREVSARSVLEGSVAQRWSRGLRSGIHNGTPFQQHWRRLWQFARCTDGWQVTALSTVESPRENEATAALRHPQG